MKKDPVKTAQEILKAFGGKENVISATHCATRLRVEVKDASIIDEEGMKEIQGVAGYFSKSGQHQVILGTGFVNKVCAEFGLMLVSPTLPNKWDVVNGVADPLSFVFGPLHLNITGYQSSVIPALFMGFFAAKLEKKLHQVIPDILDMLLVPFLTLLVSLLAGLFVVGPVLSGIEKGMTDLILMMLKLPFGIGGIAYGGLIQILCSVGMHHTVTPIIVSIFTETGVDYINPMGSAAIAGQLGAGLAIVMMQKNKQKRANMIPALIPALFGISEPVMYGLTFPRLKPFFMGCLGGAVGGGFAAIVGLCAKGTGASMIPGMLLYLQGGMIEYIIVLLLSVGVAFAGTWLIMKKNPETV